MHVWDKDTFSSDNIGIVELNLEEWKDKGKHEDWFQLTESKTDSTQTGQIRLELTFNNPPKKEDLTNDDFSDEILVDAIDAIEKPLEEVLEKQVEIKPEKQHDKVAETQSQKVLDKVIEDAPPFATAKLTFANEVEDAKLQKKADLSPREEKKLEKEQDKKRSEKEDELSDDKLPEILYQKLTNMIEVSDLEELNQHIKSIDKLREIAESKIEKKKKNQVKIRIAEAEVTQVDDSIELKSIDAITADLDVVLDRLNTMFPDPAASQELQLEENLLNSVPTPRRHVLRRDFSPNHFVQGRTLPSIQSPVDSLYPRSKPVFHTRAQREQLELSPQYYDQYARTQPILSSGSRRAAQARASQELRNHSVEPLQRRNIHPSGLYQSSFYQSPLGHEESLFLHDEVDPQQRVRFSSKSNKNEGPYLRQAAGAPYENYY